MPNVVEFYVSYLDSTVTSSLLAFKKVDAGLTAPDAYAFVDVPVSDMDDIFQIETSTDSTVPLKYYIDASKFLTKINLKYATMETSSTTDKFGTMYKAGTEDVNATDANHYSHDFIRYISRKIFGDITGAILFNNFSSVKDTLESNFLYAYSLAINSVDKTNGTDSELVSGTHGKYFTSNSPVGPDSQLKSKDIVGTLFNQLIYNDETRVEAFIADHPNGIASFPFIAGDTLSIYLTVKPAIDQQLSTNLSAATIPDKKYRLRIRLT